MTTLGYATMDLIPSAKGFVAAVTKITDPAMVSAGASGGRKFGKAMAEEIAAFAVPVAIAGVLFKIGSAFNQMEDTIRVGTGATGKQLQGLVAEATNIGKVIPASFADIGTTIVGVTTRLGLTGTTLDTFTKQFLEAGRVTKTALDMNAITGSLTAFNITGSATSGALDNLFQVSQKTGVGMNDLASAIKQGAPSLQQFGFSFRDSAAFIGALDKAGIGTTQTLFGLNSALIHFAKAGRDPAAALNTTVTAIEAFTKAGNDAAALKLAGSIFGIRGASQFVDAVKTGTVNLNDMFESLKAGSDTILQAGTETQHFREQWDLFRNNVMATVKPEADAMFKAFTDGMKWLNSDGIAALKNTSKWLEDNHGWLIKTVEVLGLLFTAYRAILIVDKVTAAFKESSKIMTLYRAGMTAIMDTQTAQAATTAAVSAAVTAATLDSDALIATNVRLGASAGVAALGTDGLVASEGALTVSAGLATRAMAFLDAAIMANPFGALALGITAAVVAGYELIRVLGGITDATPKARTGTVLGKTGGTYLADQFAAQTAKAVADAAVLPTDVATHSHSRIAANTLIADKAAAAKLAAQRKDAADAAAAAAKAAADKAAAAAAKAAAAMVKALDFKTAIETQKQTIADFARYMTKDFPASLVDGSAKGADIISGIISHVGTAISGFSATITDQVKQAQFNLGATVIQNALSAKLTGYGDALDAVNAERANVKVLMDKAQTAVNTSQSAASSLAQFLASPIGTPSELTKAFSSANTTVDTILTGYDNLVKMINDRFTTIDAQGKTVISGNADPFVAALKTQTAQLVTLVAQREDIATNLAKAQTALDDAIKVKTSYADGLSQGLKTAGASLAEFVQQVTLADGLSVRMIQSPSAMIAAFQARLNMVKNFAANIQSLTARGLGKDLIDQLVNMGADSGGALASSLTTATDAQIAALKGSSDQIAATSDALGSSLSDKFYGQSVAQAQSVVDGWKSQQTAIDSQMTAISTSIAASLAPLVSMSAMLGSDSAQALLDGFKSQDPALIAHAKLIGAQMAQAMADALAASNGLSGGPNFPAAMTNGVAASLSSAKIGVAVGDASGVPAAAQRAQAAQDAADAKAAQATQLALSQAQLDEMRRLVAAMSGQAKQLTTAARQG